MGQPEISLVNTARRYLDVERELEVVARQLGLAIHESTKTYGVSDSLHKDALLILAAADETAVDYAEAVIRGVYGTADQEETRREYDVCPCTTDPKEVIRTYDEQTWKCNTADCPCLHSYRTDVPREFDLGVGRFAEC